MEFTYQGYTFKPVGTITMRNIREIAKYQYSNVTGLSNYDWAKAKGAKSWDYDEFYKSVPKDYKNCDIFYCKENGWYCLPGANELFGWTGTFEPIKVGGTTKQDTQISAERLYVKDLQIGGIYVYKTKVSGKVYTTFYCYLGRTQQNEFLWCYITKPVEFRQFTEEYLYKACVSGKAIIKTKDLKGFHKCCQDNTHDAFECLVDHIANVVPVMGYLSLWYNYKVTTDMRVGIVQRYGLAFDFKNNESVVLLDTHKRIEFQLKLDSVNAKVGNIFVIEDVVNVGRVRRNEISMTEAMSEICAFIDTHIQNTGEVVLIIFDKNYHDKRLYPNDILSKLNRYQMQ